MRGVTLEQLVSEVQAEARQSQNPAHGLNHRASIVQLIQRTQRRLWAEHNWQHMKVSRDMPVQAGQRYYQVPADMDYERIDGIEYKYGGDWSPLVYGIDERAYSIFDPAIDQRSDPVERWDIAEDVQDTAGEVDRRGMFEIWPLPAANGEAGGSLDRNLRLTGTRNLGRLTQNNDRADLDNDLIVLFCAGELLAPGDPASSQIKLSAAQRLLLQLKGNADKKNTFVLGGDDPTEARPIEIVAHPVPRPRGP